MNEGSRDVSVFSRAALRPWRGRALVGSVVMPLVAAGAVVSVSHPAHAAWPAGFTPTADTVTNARALAVSTRHRVHVTSLDRDSVTTFVNPDGTFTDEVTTLPSRVNIAGNWVAVDPSLEQSADGSYTTHATHAQIRIGSGLQRVLRPHPRPTRRAPSAKAAATTSPRREAAKSFAVHALGTPVAAAPVVMDPAAQPVQPVLLASVGMGSGTLSYGWSGTLPAPTVSGATATYADVEPGVDLTVTATDNTVEISFVLKTAPTGDAVFDLPIQLDGLTATPDGHGQTIYTDSTGQQVGSENTPHLWDSSRDPVSDDPHQAQGTTTLTLDPASGGVQTGVREVSAPAAFLSDPSTQYPVTLDPTVTDDRYAFAYVESGQYANVSYVNDSWDASRVHVGANPDYSANDRSMYQFYDAALPNTQILGAVLHTTEDWSYSCNATKVDLFQTEEWYGGMTWNTQPSQLTYLTAQINAHGYNSSCPAAAVDWTVTNSIQNQASAGLSHFPFELVASPEGDITGWKKFYADATMDVTYNHYPDLPTGLMFSAPRSVNCPTLAAAPSFNNKNNDLAIQARQSDADTGDQIQDTFLVYNNGTAAPAMGNIVTPFTLAPAWRGGTIPKGTLSDGTYAWRVYGTDNHGATGPAAPVGTWCYFKIKNEAPPPPSILRNGVPVQTPAAVQPTDADAQKLTFSVSPSAQVTEFLYSNSSANPTTIPACGSSVTTGNTTVWGVCPTNGSSTVTLAFPYGVTQLFVWSVDVAGNVTGADATYTPIELTVSVYADANPMVSGHGWLIDYDPTHPAADPPAHPATAPATASDGTYNQTYASPLALNGAGWTEVNPLGPASNGNRTVWGLHLTGSQTPETQATVVDIHGVPLDSTQSFTSGVWVHPTAAGAMTALSQDLGTNSAFTLGLDSNGHPRFCVGDGTVAPANMACVSDTTSTVGVGQWAYLIGWWDNVQGFLHVQTSLPGQDLTDVSAAHATFAPHGAGQIALGWDRSGTAAADGFTGDLAGAMFYQGVPGNDVRTAQLIDLAAPAVIPPPPAN